MDTVAYGAATAFAVTAPAVTTVTARGWADRGIALPLTTTRTAILQILAGITAASIAYLTGQTAAVIISTAAWTAAVTVTVLTDLASRKAPREMFWVAGALTTAITVWQISTTPAIWTTAAANAIIPAAAAALWLAAPTTIGFSDVRYLAVTATAFGWWMNPILTLIALLIGLLSVPVIKTATHTRWRTRWPLIPFLAATQSIAVIVTFLGQ